MTCQRRKCIWPTLLLLLATGISEAANPDGPKAEALVRSRASIVLDGRLDEPVWREAPELRLVQQSPKPGAATPYETAVRIIVTADRIYFGFLCRDPHPGQISIHTMRRDETMGQDGETKSDDTVSIVLDTYGDRRTDTFFRSTRPGRARTDSFRIRRASLSTGMVSGTLEPRERETAGPPR